MARIIYSGLVTEIKGSVGGTTFQSNAYGYTVKNKANIVRPNSVLQNQRKLYLSVASQKWKGLSSAQRADWVAWAAANPQYAKNNPGAVLSAFAVFVKWHVQYYIGTGDVSFLQTTPSYSFGVIDAPSFSLDSTAGVLLLKPDFSLEQDLLYLNIFMSQPIQTTVNFIGSRIRFIIQVTDENSNTDITNEYTAQYGRIPVEGERVFVENVQYTNNAGMVYARQSQVLTVETTP